MRAYAVTANNTTNFISLYRNAAEATAKHFREATGSSCLVREIDCEDVKNLTEARAIMTPVNDCVIVDISSKPSNKSAANFEQRYSTGSVMRTELVVRGLDKREVMSVLKHDIDLAKNKYYPQFKNINVFYERN